jgi:flagellar biogenesis protein FliO
MRRLPLSLAAALCCWFASENSQALEPAGGPAEPPSISSSSDAPVSPPLAPEEQPDASVAAEPSEAPQERSWLARGSPRADEAPAEGPARRSGLTLGAVVIIVGLGVGAVVLRQKRRKLAPIAAMESRLDILSSSRVGPKAYAVTAHVGGRVMLLGVTDHSVTHLCWIDQPDPEGSSPDAEPRAAASAEVGVDDLPDDYPGSALRAAARHPAQLASARDLKRFQDVLRGTTPRGSPARAPEELPSAASALAAQTSDVLMASFSAAGRGPLPASVRRKRQRRQDQMASSGSESAAALEGQVAGLRALRDG